MEENAKTNPNTVKPFRDRLTHRETENEPDPMGIGRPEGDRLTHRKPNPEEIRRANPNTIKPFRDEFEEIQKMVEGERPPGVKYDGEKIDPALLPAEVLREVAKVLTQGARKYSPDNWKFVENRRHRYTSALLRHLYEFQISPNSVDPETNLSHIAHVVANAVFLCYGVLEDNGGTAGTVGTGRTEGGE